MKRFIAPLLLITCLCWVAVGTPSAEAGRKGVPRADRHDETRTGIVNQVLDLLDGEVVLSTEIDEGVWESARFDTSQFNRIGLRLQVDATQGPVTCRVCWQFSPDDEYLEGTPVVSNFASPDPFQWLPGDYGRTVFTNPFLPGGDGPERPDGLDDRYSGRSRQHYPVGSYSQPTPLTDAFGEVRGLGARVRCELPVFQNLGDDPSLRTDVSRSVTLTDVKVLLRRE